MAKRPRGSRASLYCPGVPASLQRIRTALWYTSIMAEPEQIPYWLVNVPRDEWPTEGVDAPCPSWLQDLPSRVEAQLAKSDDQNVLLSWPETTKIIRENQLQELSRVPSQLRRYFYFIDELKRNWGSVVEFVRRRRVKWDDLTPADPEPFANAGRSLHCIVKVGPVT